MSDEPKYRDEEWLREQYIEQQKSMREIANVCNTTHHTISRWVENHSIERRRPNAVKDKRLRDKDWLYHQYVNQQKSTKKIADECDCSAKSVRRWIKKHGIKMRTGVRPAPDDRLCDSDWLSEKYVDEQKTTYQIAHICGCNNTTVSRWLKRHGIKIRGGGIGKDNPQWNGGRADYGMGWNRRKRRQVRERDNHTCQDPRCSVTQDEHVDKYGEKLHVHHLRKARDVDDPEERNAPENLITLCRDCHNRWEKIADAGLVPQLHAGETAD